MSKSRHNRKWYDDYDDDVYEDKKNEKLKTRRQQKKMKNALKSLDVNVLSNLEEE